MTCTFESNPVDLSDLWLKSKELLCNLAMQSFLKCSRPNLHTEKELRRETGLSPWGTSGLDRY